MGHMVHVAGKVWIVRDGEDDKHKQLYRTSP